MNLTQRTCRDCGAQFDILQDKYFIKRLSKFKLIIEILIKCIIPTIMYKNIFEVKLICESCNRDRLIDQLIEKN